MLELLLPATLKRSTVTVTGDFQLPHYVVHKKTATLGIRDRGLDCTHQAIEKSSDFENKSYDS